MFIIVITLCLTLSNATPHTKIVNGTDAEDDEFPYIISLRGLFRQHNCGGSILSPYFILTAAHCVSSGFISVLNIQYGVVEISRDNTNSIPVEKVAIHENFAPLDGYRNDIAILKLASAIPLSEKAQPVKLPVQNQHFDGWSIGTLIGWGLPNSEGNIVTHLQKVNIFIYPQDECKKAHGSQVDGINHVCAGVPEGGKGQCNGDSGGPLTLNGVQVGIVSWSVKPCTIAGYPGVFTRVAHHINWIKKKMETM